MTAPRQVLPGTTYLLTRRVARRQLLLRPSEEVNQVFSYCFAHAAARAGVLLHAISVLGNHVHAVLTDPDGRLPELTRWLFEYTAKCINVMHGRWENVWSSEPPSQVRLESPEVVVEKILYLMTNPVAAALVARADQWPGVVTLPADYLRGGVEVKRPKVFFRENSPAPATVTLKVVPPAGVEEKTPEAFVKMLSERLAQREEELRKKLRAEGRTILGRKAVKAQDPFSYPGGMEPRRNLKPRVAAANKWARMEALGRLKSFDDTYPEARARFLKGDRDVVFPAGTYWLVKHAGARCAAPG